jgi:two-component sensor histidine kinase
MLQEQVQEEAPSGLAAAPTLRWGSHIGHLFDTADELHEVLVPYFRAGLQNNERCLWVTGTTFSAAEARAALRSALPDLDRRERNGQIEILDGAAFYDPGEPAPAEALVAGLLQRADEALASGFKGLRTNGDCAWVDHRHWGEFRRYEELVQKSVRGGRLICMCSYRPDRLHAAEVVDVVDRHDFVLRPHGGPRRPRPAAEPEAYVTGVALRADAGAPTLDAWLELDQSILDALPIGFYCCDGDGQILRANRKAVALWGRTVRLLDSVHRFCGSLRLRSLDGSVIPPEQSPMARAVLEGESFDGAETIMENPDGKRWVARHHAAPLRDLAGRVVGGVDCFQDISPEYEMRQALERQQRTFDLAMTASEMGTWRYTLADNVCVYDENAQRLYGLTEARFLHDARGVKEKFHPDDMELMWSRVAKALDPTGDGRYDVEYRVKQPDGGWRWLSAWGTVEFDGEGAGRKAVAISGASRDLSGSKKAEELQRLLVNELNHRVKNTLATVQSIVFYTLRGATDLQAGRDALNERIISLARVHDLLTARSWSGADVRDVVHRAMEPFSAAQLDLSGPSAEVSPRHALAVSLALHELATNAAKYGALSTPGGRIEVRWTSDAERLNLSWRESGGPPVTPPTRRGFGTRLLATSLAREFGEGSRLEYAPEGVRFDLSAPL